MPCGHGGVYCMDNHRFDLHSHSTFSDGADTPTEVVTAASNANVRLLALSDHDCVLGVPEAMAAGARMHVGVVPAVELDTEWAGEMHILGLDVDIRHPALTEALEGAKRRRDLRNERILEQLALAGYDVRPYMKAAEGTLTRLQIAMALAEAGFARDVSDAFVNFFAFGKVGYCPAMRPTPEEAIATILAAGGVPVWAHPFLAQGNVHETMSRLVAGGLQGVEAYHPSATKGQSAILVSLAVQNRLWVTCGSDSHGENRPGVHIGQTWRETPELEKTYRYFTERISARA